MSDNIVDLPLGINESERLTKALMDAMSAFYRSQGKIDEKGRASVSPRRALRALAATAGYILHTAPSAERDNAYSNFVGDVAEHAGVKCPRV